MNKQSATIAAVLILAGATAAQQAKKAASTAYVNSAAVKAAALHAATTITGVGQGFVPYVSDGSGTLSPSSIFQLSGNIGVNNTAPAVPLHAGSAAASGTQIEAEGANGSFAVVNHGNAPNSANFTFVTASNGTLAGDELGQLGGIGSLPGGALGGSTSVKEVFAAAATFAPGSTPGEILWYTTPIGSTSHQLRMTLDQNGRLGIGTAAPGAPLEVNGAIQIDNANLVLNGSSGIQFPTGTQSAPGVVSVTQGNSSITVGGTALAPTVAVNTGVIQPLLNGTTSCPSGQAVTGINPSTGAITCASVGGGGSGSGLTVKDASSNVLGSLLSVNGPIVTILSTSGYIVHLDIGGWFVAAPQADSTEYTIYWSGNNCASLPSTPYVGADLPISELPPTLPTNYVFYSYLSNTMYVPTGGGGFSNVAVTSYSSFEENMEQVSSGLFSYTGSDAYSQCQTTSPQNFGLFPLQTLSAGTLGWTITTGTGPLDDGALTVAGPLVLP